MGLKCIKRRRGGVEKENKKKNNLIHFVFPHFRWGPIRLRGDAWFFESHIAVFIAVATGTTWLWPPLAAGEFFGRLVRQRKETSSVLVLLTVRNKATVLFALRRSAPGSVSCRRTLCLAFLTCNPADASLSCSCLCRSVRSPTGFFP